MRSGDVPHRGDNPNARATELVPVLLVLSALALAILARPALGLASEAVSRGAEAAWYAHFVLTAALGSWALVGAVRSAGQRAPLRRTATLVVSAVNLFAVSMPAMSLVWPSRVAIVDQLYGAAVATPEALAGVLSLFSATLLAFAIGESVGARIRKQVPRGATAPTPGIASASLTLTLIGLAVHVAQLQRGIGSDFDSRGTAEGEGLRVVLGWALPVGIALAFQGRHWGSKSRLAISLIGVSVLVLGGVRSPLALIVVACVPRILEQLASRGKRLFAWPALLVGAHAALSVAAGLSSWRGSVRKGQPVPLTHAIRDAALDPIGSLTGSGVDTVDGLVFVRAVSGSVASFRPQALLIPVLTLIPRQLYPDKPEFITNTLSRQYLKFGAAGMFMSGPGYLWLVLGSAAAAVATFGFLGLLLGRLMHTGSMSWAWPVLAYFIFRFTMAGGEYDFLISFEIALLILFALLAVRLLTLAREASGLAPKKNHRPSHRGRGPGGHDELSTVSSWRRGY